MQAIALKECPFYLGQFDRERPSFQISSNILYRTQAEFTNESRQPRALQYSLVEQPLFEPDGRKIIYTKYAVGAEGDPNARTDVFVYDLTTARETQLTHTGISVQHSWSPHGLLVRAIPTLTASLQCFGLGNHARRMFSVRFAEKP